MKKLVFLLAISVVLNGCSILSKVFVRNYHDVEITLLVENLWITENAKKGRVEKAAYATKILKINSAIYEYLNDTLAFSYDANGTLGIKIPANSTVLLEKMPNAAPAKEIKAIVLKVVNSKEQKIATYTTNDLKYKSFHKYWLDVKPE